MDTPHPPSASPGTGVCSLWCTVLDRDLGKRQAVIERSSVASRRRRAPGRASSAGRPRWGSTARAGTWRSPERSRRCGRCARRCSIARRYRAPSSKRSSPMAWSAACSRSTVAPSACPGRGAPPAQLGIGACRFLGLAARRRLWRCAGGVAGTRARQDQGRPGAVPWTAMGALSLAATGSRSAGWAAVRGRCPPGPPRRRRFAPGTRLRLSVTLAEDDRAAVAYADCAGNPSRRPCRAGQRRIDHATSGRS